MGKVSWGVKGSDVDSVEVEDREQFDSYDGPVPPKGIYRVKLERAEYVQFSTGSKGLKLLLLIDEPSGSRKKQYNGCPLWENLIDLESTAFKIRQWMDAIGGTGKDWDGTVVDTEKMVTKFGRIKADGLQVRVATKLGSNQDGDKRAEVARFLPLVDAKESADDSDSDYDGVEPPF